MHIAHILKQNKQLHKSGAKSFPVLDDDPNIVCEGAHKLIYVNETLEDTNEGLDRNGKQKHGQGVTLFYTRPEHRSSVEFTKHFDALHVSFIQFFEKRNVLIRDTHDEQNEPQVFVCNTRECSTHIIQYDAGGSIENTC